MMWDPAVYRRYGTERSRPFTDLVAQIGADQPRTVVDLGCGPGDLTATLPQRWPAAKVVGLDSSPAMIERAQAHAGVIFGQADVRQWRPEPDVDVVVTNAVLQWVPGHQDLLVRWIGELPPGAWLAMQVPGNFAAPSHLALRELFPDAREAPVDEPAGYADLLSAAGATVNAWETTYLHLLPAEGPDHPVLRWMEGTALRPVRDRLDDAAWQDFRVALATRLAVAYPVRDGRVVFPFRRIFVVAQKE